MARIGIFIDGMGRSIPATFREKIVSVIRELPEVAFSVEEEDLTSPEALRRMAEHLKAEGVDRVVILGGSPKIYETSFRKFGYPISLNPYLLAVANLKEQALQTTANEEEAIEKARKLMIKAIHVASSSNPIESQSLPLKPETLIIGGGITGISIALTLARSGIQVYLMEKGKSLGGKAMELRTFYNRPEEVQKWMEERISEVRRNSRITVLSETELK